MKLLRKVVMFSGVQSEWKADYDRKTDFSLSMQLKLDFQMCVSHIFISIPKLSPTIYMSVLNK